ncbi:MAG TPA: TetR/AcrR family transcriptional regulator [Cellulomonas sp.]
MTDASSAAVPRKRVRLTPEQRRAQILQVSARLIAEHGFYGISLQNVADAVGITQAGLLHYVRNKDGLLEMLVEQQYDRQGTPTDFVASGDPAATHPGGPSFPAYCRYLVDFNSRRPELMKLYMVLSAEAASPAHPAHDYFATRPTAVWQYYQQTPWRLPPSVGSFEDIQDLVELSLEAMDGIQVRVFRRPAIDMNAEWARFDRLLFPSPVWDDYR